MKQIQLFLLQFTLLLLLGFTSVASAPFSLFTTDVAGSVEAISTESSLENTDDFAQRNNLEGNTDSILSQPSLIFYPLSIKIGQTSSRPLPKPVPLYILYQRLIFYHPVA